MIRAVLDTNLLVSYLLSHRPPMAALIDEHARHERLRLLTGAVLLEELDRVLSHRRLQRYFVPAQRARFVALLAAVSELVDLPESVPRICRDPDDDWVIACAVVGKADVVASGDKDLLDLRQVGEIPIWPAARLLAFLEERQAQAPEPREVDRP